MLVPDGLDLALSLHSMDMELQQRAVEYSVISTDGAMTAKVFDFIPPFAKDKKSGLLAKLSKENSKTADRNVWASQDTKREAEASVLETRKAKKSDAASAEPAPVEDSLIDLGDSQPKGQPAGVDSALSALIAK